LGDSCIRPFVGLMGTSVSRCLIAEDVVVIMTDACAAPTRATMDGSIDSEETASLVCAMFVTARSKHRRAVGFTQAAINAPREEQSMHP
jgi:hypothetical protein